MQSRVSGQLLAQGQGIYGFNEAAMLFDISLYLMVKYTLESPKPAVHLIDIMAKSDTVFFPKHKFKGLYVCSA
jgi:hypothetical protein